MTLKDIIEQRPRLQSLIAKGRLHDAFSLILGLSESLMLWEITDKIKTAESNYRFMLGYAVEGIADSTRTDFIENLGEQLESFMDQIILQKKLTDNSYDLAVNNFRQQRLKSDKLADFLQYYISIYPELVKSGSIKDIENLERDIFNYIWTTIYITEEDKSLIHNLMYSDLSSDSVRNLIIAALFMRIFTIGYSTDYLLLLLDIYDKVSDPVIRTRALTLSMLVMMNFYDRIPKGRIRNKLDSISRSQAESWDSDIKSILVEIIRTKETERINKKMREDIIPNMMKMGPKIKEKFKNLDEEEIMNLEENPEWRNLFKESGFADSLMELNKLQMEGADVMMSTFGHLKTFPFFNEIHNWFLPFTPNHSAFAFQVKANDPIARILRSTNMICDSDAYSFMFSLSQMPDSQRSMMAANIGEQLKAFEDMVSGRQTVADVRIISNLYIKNLYRFFNLFRRKGEFQNPFAGLLNPVDFKLVLPYIGSKETMKLFAEQYFYLEEWNDAYKIYKYLENNGEVNASLLQKLGFCRQKVEDYEMAYTYYLQADLLDPDNIWTLRKLAFCSKKLGKYSSAVEYYNKLVKLKPEDVRTVMSLGRCLMEIGEYKEASKRFYQAYYLDSESEKILLALIRSLFMSGEIEESEKQLTKILDSTEDGEPFIIQGNIFYLNGDYKNALAQYKKAYKKYNNNREMLMERIESDRNTLKELSGKDGVFNQLMEQLQYEIDNN